MVFQSYALFPHLPVFENVAYGLRIRRMPERDVKRKVGAILKTLGLDAMATRFPADLSGGQQQRVSIARALVYDPGMLLLDEPLANLDAKLRVEMREEIRRIQKELGIMALYVTHDQEEAMSISDRVAVFNKGRLMQVGLPEEVYSRPRSLFVADFVGKANFFPADALKSGSPAVQVGLRDGATVEVERHYRAEIEEADRVPQGAKGLLMVRPEQIELLPQGAGPHACRVRRRQFLGSFVRYVAESEIAVGELLIDMRRPVEGVDENGAASFALHRREACFFQR
jgi:ABC-type Fe3+/spermidine/putrescine transport system ATPase subunit